jgi:site-specific recombinase XerD
MVREMELRRLAPRTQQAYAKAVWDMTRFYRRSPDQLGREDIKSYLLHLMDERHLNWSTVNVASAGIRFFYAETLGRPDLACSIPKRKTPRRLPEILSAEEIERLFAVTTNLKHRALLMTTYAAGLRVSEVARLRVADLDGARRMIRVRGGKGDKDRYTVLSQRLLIELRAYWRAYRPGEWLFPGATPGQPINPDTVGEVYHQARQKAGITKRGGIHTLRHCFATHLLEAGVDVRTIQILMGHRSIRTTIEYIQVTAKKIEATPSPLDLLPPRPLPPGN